MKIVIATPLYPPEIGGPATYAALINEEFPKKGHEVALVKFGDVRHLPKGIAHLAYFFNVLKAGKKADLIYALDVSSVGLPAAFASAILRKRFAAKMVGDYAWEQGAQRFGVTETLDEFVKRPSHELPFGVRFLRLAQTFVTRRASRIIVPSEYLKRIVSAWGIDPKKIAVVYNAFDVPAELLSKDEARRTLALDGRIVLSAGRLVPWKGFATLIDVFSKIIDEFPDAKLLIAGDGPLAEELTERINERGLAERIILLGRLAHDELIRYVRAADCFVLNTGYEGLSHQLLEVMAAGTPIVTTAVGGNPELIEDKVRGILIPYDDKERLCEAILHMLRDLKNAEGMAGSAKAFVGGFSSERMILGTLEVLRNTGKNI